MDNTLSRASTISPAAFERVRLKPTVIWIAATALVGVYALPYVYLILTSLKPANDVLQIPPSFWPERFSLENYGSVLSNASVPASFLNSAVVAIGSTLLSLLLAVPAAYGASFFPNRLSNWFLLFALVTRMVPSVSLGLPLFVLMRSAGLLDTPLGLILAHTTLSLPLSIWMMAAFFESVPRELEEAARIDGCSRLGALVWIILPVVSGGAAVTALFAFIASWNEFLYALLLTSQRATTAPIVISEFKTAYGLSWGPMTAMAVLYSAPVILVSLVLQKQIVGGLTFGAVKG